MVPLFLSLYTLLPAVCSDLNSATPPPPPNHPPTHTHTHHTPPQQLGIWFEGFGLGIIFFVDKPMLLRKEHI